MGQNKSLIVVAHMAWPEPGSAIRRAVFSLAFLIRDSGSVLYGRPKILPDRFSISGVIGDGNQSVNEP